MCPLGRFILTHWAPSKGSTKLDAFLYLKKEAESASETLCYIERETMGKVKRITSVRYLELNEDEVRGYLRKLHNEELRDLYSLPNIIG